MLMAGLLGRVRLTGLAGGGTGLEPVEGIGNDAHLALDSAFHLGHPGNHFKNSREAFQTNQRLTTGCLLAKAPSSARSQSWLIRRGTPPDNR